MSTINHTTTDLAGSHQSAEVRLGDLDRYVDAILNEAELFATAADGGSLDVPIAACPGWDMRQLVEHVGSVHLWAAANIAYPSSSWISVRALTDLERYWPDLAAGVVADEGLIAWYRATVRRLIEVIRSTPPDHECLTFLPAPSPLIMWARRQASEVAIHRHDAEASRGIESHYEPSFALDMLDELLVGFAPKMQPSMIAEEHVLRISFDEVDYGFLVTMSPTGIRTAMRVGDDPSPANAHAQLSGSAAGLYLLLWNRPPGPTVRLDGDPGVLDQWAASCRIEWKK